MTMLVPLTVFLGYLVSASLADIDSPGCGTNGVGFDYGNLPGKISKRIIGGQIATPHTFPWMVSLQFKGFHRCGGSLIKGATKWYIFTSAHCQHGTLATDWKAVIGLHDLSHPETTSQTLDIIHFMPHPLFSAVTLEYDMALAELSNVPDLTNPNINFACIQQAAVTPSENCYVIGWGSTIVGGPPTDFLQVVDKPIMPTPNCTNIYGPNFHPDSMLCAGYDAGGKDSCSFDSGGPLMCHRNGRMEIVGTVSWGFGCAEPNSPAVYSRASAAITWVQQTINA